MKLDPELQDITHVFTASIETCTRGIVKHAYHLGTDRKIAEWFCEELFRRHNADGGVYTVALVHNGAAIDYYDGRDWAHKNPWHPSYVP